MSFGRFTKEKFMIIIIIIINESVSVSGFGNRRKGWDVRDRCSRAAGGYPSSTRYRTC